MAKKSPLSDAQWKEIEKRLLAGEGSRALSRVYGVPESTIRTRLSAHTAQVKKVANQVIEAEQNFYALPIAAQISAQTLINELRSISIHLAAAARYGAMTAHKLNGIANQQMEMIDETDLSPDSQSMETLRTVAALTEVANKSSQTGINLLNANKDMVKKDSEQDQTSKASTLDDKTKAAKLAGLLALAKAKAEHATAG